MSYSGVLQEIWEKQSAEKLTEEVAAAAAIQSGEIKITEQKWGSIVATNISPLTVSIFKGLHLEQRTKFISALSALKGNENFFISFERTLKKNKNKELFDYLYTEINTQSGGTGGIAVNVMALSFIAVIGNLLINNGNTALSQGAISEALAQHSPGEWGKFISTTIGLSAKESNVPSILGDPRLTDVYEPGTRYLEQQDKITQTSKQLKAAGVAVANAMPNAASTLFEMNNRLSESILKGVSTQSDLTSELQTAQAKYRSTQAILSESEGWWSSSARDAARSDAAAAQMTLEGIQTKLVGHINPSVIGNVFAEIGEATWENCEALREKTLEAERQAKRLVVQKQVRHAGKARPSPTPTTRPSPSPSTTTNTESDAAQENVDSTVSAAVQTRATEVRLEAEEASRKAEAAVATQMASDLAAGKVVYKNGKLKFGVHEFNATGTNMSTTKSDFLKLFGLKGIMQEARRNGESDGSKVKGVFKSNYGVEHAPNIDNPATIFRKATDKLGFTTAAEKSSLQTFAELIILNEYSIGFEGKAQQKLELLRQGINQAEGVAASKDYSAVKTTLKAALLKNGKIAVPDGKSGTRELNDVEVDTIVNEIVETAAGVGKIPKNDKIDAFAMEILTQVRGTGKLDTIRRSWFLRAERNAKKPPVEILSDNILLLTLIGTVFGGVAIVGAAFENPMKHAMARAANRQGAAAAEATRIQAKAAADESRARAEHQRALTAAAKAQAAALQKVTEAEAASKIAKIAANKNANKERGQARNRAEAALKEARAAAAVVDKHIQELKKAGRNKTRTNGNGNNMPPLEKTEEELERELKEAEDAESAARAAARAASNAAAAKKASNDEATAAAASVAAALKNQREKEARAEAARAEAAPANTQAARREERAAAAMKRAGQHGGTRRRRIYRSRTRRH